MTSIIYYQECTLIVFLFDEVGENCIKLDLRFLDLRFLSLLDDEPVVNLEMVSIPEDSAKTFDLGPVSWAYLDMRRRSLTSSAVFRSSSLPPQDISRTATFWWGDVFSAFTISWSQII